MQNMLNSIGIYDFITHFTPGLILLSAITLRFNLWGKIGKLFSDGSFITGVLIIFVIILSYILGNIIKTLFGIITKCNTISKWYYRAQFEDQKTYIYDNCALDKFIENIKDKDDSSLNFNYYNNAFKDRVKIEHLSSVLMQANVNGDYIKYFNLKFFYQLMSCVSIIIFVFLCFINRLLDGNIFNNYFIIPLILYGGLFIFEILNINKNENCEIIGNFYIWISVITIIIAVFALFLNIINLNYDNMITIISFSSFIFFREMFIIAYNLYLDNVITTYNIFNKRKKKNNSIDENKEDE